MCYSIKPRDRRYVKGYGFSSSARNIGKNIGKNISNKYSQKLVDIAKKSATDAIKIASKSAIQKIVQATGDLIANKIADKITSVSKKFKDLPPTELHSNEANNEILKERYISPPKKDNELLMN